MPETKPNGLYEFTELERTLDVCFNTEKELCEFIERNMENFCLELGFKYKSHIREYMINGFRRKDHGNKRIDFLITTECGSQLAIECKKPYYLSELCAGIGQILSYITITEDVDKRIDRFYLISTRIDLNAPFIISRFNLPITFIAMDKSKMLTWQM